ATVKLRRRIRARPPPPASALTRTFQSTPAVQTKLHPLAGIAPRSQQDPGECGTARRRGVRSPGCRGRAAKQGTRPGGTEGVRCGSSSLALCR
uniref:Uncharacterized protein n=1 Tax=Aegilops tauschii subsp. strangulata TaxID=200361 RepID=A0A453M219_AEGTS